MLLNGKTDSSRPRVLAAAPPPAIPAAAEGRGLVKIYGEGEGAVRALDRVSVKFETGTYSAVMGPSGSGKSTLMHAIGGLENVDGGQVLIGGTHLTRMSETERTILRRDKIGFIFQNYNLIPVLSAQENITLPLLLAGRRLDSGWLHELTGILGIGDRLDHLPGELSGGQQQRVAVARALITRPAIVLADEPTGNLDSNSGKALLALLRDAVDRLGQTVAMVTHDPVAASYADRAIFLADGRVVDEVTAPTVDGILDRIRQFDRKGEGATS